jgi:MFS family permease
MIKSVKNQQIWILMTAQFLLIIATSMSQPYWPLILGLKVGSTGLNFTLWNILVYTLPLLFTAIAAPIWGSLADRFGYKKLLLRAAICLLITQSLLVFARTPFEFCACRLIQGVFCGSIAASQALGIKIVRKNEKPLVISQLQSVISLGMIVGPILGGYIFHPTTYSELFKLSAIICLVASFILFYLIKEPPQTKHINKEYLTDKLNQTSNKILIPISIMLAQIARFMILPIFAIYITSLLKKDTSTIGILYAASGMALLISAPLIGKLFTSLKLKNINLYILPSIAYFISFILYMLLPYIHSYTFVFLNRCLWGCCLAAIIPLLYSINITLYPQYSHGKAIGLASSANKTGALCGIILGSLFSYKFGMTQTLHLIAYVYLLNFLYLQILNVVQHKNKFSKEIQHA